MIERVQEKVQHITNWTTPTSAVTAAAGWFTFNEWMALIGCLCAVISMGVNWYYQYKRDRREERNSQTN